MQQVRPSLGPSARAAPNRHRMRPCLRACSLQTAVSATLDRVGYHGLHFLFTLNYSHSLSKKSHI